MVAVCPPRGGPRGVSGQLASSFFVFPVQTTSPVVTTVPVHRHRRFPDRAGTYFSTHLTLSCPTGAVLPSPCLPTRRGAQCHSGRHPRLRGRPRPRSGLAAVPHPALCLLFPSVLFWCCFVVVVLFCLQLDCFNVRIRFHTHPTQSFSLDLAPRPSS